MTHMQEIIFDNAYGDHLGTILNNPFEGEDADSNQSPETGFEYAYLMGWKLSNTSSGEEKGIIINIADTPKTIQYDANYPIFNNSNMRCIHITSFNNDGVPSIDQYINGDGDLNYDTTDVVFSMIIPPYSVNLFETYISGCTDVSACNFDPDTSVDDGSCEYCSCQTCSGQDHGACVDGVGSYTCTCNSYYSGTDCGTDIDECATNNGGCGDVAFYLCANNDGAAPTCSEISIFNGIIPEDFSIHSIYPNPFNPATNIIYGLPEHVNVQMIVYDLSGKQIHTLINQLQTSGYYSISWNASSYPSGVYLIRMESGEFTQTQKVVLVK